MKVIDELPYVDFRKLVQEPIKYIMDVWEFIVVFYTVVNRIDPIRNMFCKSLFEKNFLKKMKDSIIFHDFHKMNGPKIDFDEFTDMFKYYKYDFITYSKKVSNEELKKYLQQYINLYREGKIYGEKKNYKNFANSQEAVYKIIQKSQEECGDCIIMPIPYNTEEDKKTRFFEIIAYLYLNDNIQIEVFSVEEDDKELFLKIRILHDINNLYGITIDKDKNVLYKGKKVDITYKKNEFILIKELVDNKGKIDKQKFFEQVKWGNNAEKNKNRMNGLKNRVLLKLKECGADNLQISQAGAYIELKKEKKIRTN